ncbi:unnamed protein product [Bubo scandiacus]
MSLALKARQRGEAQGRHQGAGVRLRPPGASAAVGAGGAPGAEELHQLRGAARGGGRDLPALRRLLQHPAAAAGVRRRPLPRPAQGRLPAGHPLRQLALQGVLPRAPQPPPHLPALRQIRRCGGHPDGRGSSGEDQGGAEGAAGAPL